MCWLYSYSIVIKKNTEYEKTISVIYIVGGADCMLFRKIMHNLSKVTCFVGNLNLDGYTLLLLDDHEVDLRF